MNIKKRFTGVALAAGIGAVLLGGGTFALFTSSAVNEGNTFSAGSVAITDLTGGGNVFAGTLYVSNLAPGDSESGVITIKNDGSLDAWVTIDSVTGSGALFEGTHPVTLSSDSGVVKLAPGEEYSFNVQYSFPLEAGDEYQNADGTVSVSVKAVQARNNSQDNNGDGTVDGPISWN